MNRSTSLPFCCAERRPPAGARCQQGFTLVEVLVAVTMIALLLTTVYGAFAALSNAQARLEREDGGFHRARVVFDRLGRELRGAYFSTRNSGTLFEGGKSAGDAPYIAFSTTAGTPAAGAGAGITRVRYTLEADPEGEPGEKVLMRGEALLFADVAAEERRFRLAPAIDSLTIRYRQGEEWVEEWNARPQSGLPTMVEVALTIVIDGQPRRFVTAFDLPKLTGAP